MPMKDKTTLSFEERVLTSHDWTAKAQEPAITRVTQDDYDDGVQEIYIERESGQLVRQRRQWEGYDHDGYYEYCKRQPEPTAEERLTYIEDHSELIEEEEVRPADEEQAVGAPAELPEGAEVISLEALETLSMEFRQELMKDATTAFKKLIGLGDIFRRFVARRQLRKEFQFDDYDFKRFAASINKHPFTSMTDLRVFCPPGMSTRYLELFTILLECQKYAERTLNESLRPFKRWCGEAYNDPEKLRSIRKSEAFKILSPDSLSKQLSAACSFQGVTTRPYGDCFERNGDWTELQKKVEELFATYPAANVETFDTETKEAARLVGMLTNQIGVLGKDKVSQEVAEQLGESCYELARQIEFYAVYNTVMRSSLAALKDTMDHFEKKVLR